MEQIGVHKVAEAKRHLNHFVQNEIFRGQSPPPVSRRRYNPTNKDIRNIMFSTGHHETSDDQTNLHLKCVKWTSLHPNDFIHFRVSKEITTFK